jgi:hypothetical protein
LLVATCLPITSTRLIASAPPPVIRASRSVNGRFLVVTEYEYENPNDEIRRIRRTTYRVLETEFFINDKDRLSAPVSFWSESAGGWEVTLEGLEGKQMFWPMITDNGQSLILVGVTAPGPTQTVLKIYRRKSYKGELVRSYQLTDLWTAKQINPDDKRIIMVTDATPLWFAGGTLAFSHDDQQLIYRNQWNDELRISLADGVISQVRR